MTDMDEIYNILQSPDDGTAIGSSLKSEQGIQYRMTDSGVLMLEKQTSLLGNSIYQNPMFEKWNSIVEERINYYTKKQSLAGRLAQWSYRRIHQFNNRKAGEWLLDIGCGDGAHLHFLKDRSTYIGIDLNLNRLEILKRKYPEVVTIYADAATLPFKSKAIKHVFSSNAFEHIWYLKDAVMELNRCCATEASAIIVIPTEGGLWNIGRNLLSKPHFSKRHPDIDFEFISHVEHCNQAKQVIRSLETFFEVEVRGIPALLPWIWLNPFLEIRCKPRRF